MNSYSQPRAWFPIILTIVFAVSSCFAEAAKNPYDQKLQSLSEQWKASGEARKAVILGEIYDLREFVTDAAAVTSQLKIVTGHNFESALIRDEASWHLAQIAVHEGRIEDARNQADALGLVRDWVRIDDENCAALGRNSRRSNLKAGPLGVVTVHTSRPICAVTAVYSSSTVDAALRFGASVPLTLYVNGTKVKAGSQVRDFGFDQAAFGTQLRAGWNTFAIELSGEEDAQTFALRVTGPSGGGVPLQADASRAVATGSVLSRVDVTDLLQIASQDSDSAEGLSTLAALEQLRGINNDEHLQEAVKMAPTAERWLAVAKACADQNCAFAAMNRALAIESNYGPAKSAMAEYYVGRGQLEKARDLFQEILQNNADDFVTRKKFADVLFAAGASVEAMSEYKHLASDGHIPIWLKREIALRYTDAGLTAQATLLLNQVWKNSFDDDRVRAALAGLAERRGDIATLQMLAECAETVDPMDPQVTIELARYGAKARTQAVVGESAEYHLQHADMLAFAGETREASAELMKAAKYDGRIQLPRSTPASSVLDSAYLLDPAKLAADARRTPPNEKSNVISLADVNIERILPTGQSVVHAQQIFYIANDRGARDYSIRSVQYSHATQKLSVLAARVYKADGRVLDADDQGESSVADTSVSMYYDTRSHAYRFPSLEKGDVICLEYRISPNSNVNPYGNYFGALIAFQNGLPQKLHRYVLVASTDRKLNIVEQRMPVKAVILQKEGNTVYRWDATNIAPLTTEPRGPSLTEVAPYVSVSTFEDWTQLGRWYAKMIAPQFALDGELRDALSRITAETKTEQEKIHAIHEFVLRNTHYVAMEFGVYSYKPYPVSQVYARRFGDCKDKASLMIALLRGAGVDADLALVRTRKLGDVSEHATNIAIFNHAVAYIPKYDLWLDGTAEYAGSRELPLDDQGAMALTVNVDGEATLRRIPVTLPMQNYTHRVVRAEVQQDGNILFTGSAYTRGEDAPGLRREYELPDRQRDTVRSNLAQVYPSVRVDTVHVDGAQDIERDINVKFSGSLDKFAGSKELGLTSSWLPHQYVNSLASATTRSQDLLLPAPWTTEEEIHFVVPEGANIESVPTNLNYETPFGTAVIKYERRGRELVVNTSVQFRRLRITPSEYTGFREFCSEVEKAFRRDVKVRLAG